MSIDMSGVSGYGGASGGYGGGFFGGTPINANGNMSALQQQQILAKQQADLALRQQQEQNKFQQQGFDLQRYGIDTNASTAAAQRQLEQQMQQNDLASRLGLQTQQLGFQGTQNQADRTLKQHLQDQQLQYQQGVQSWKQGWVDKLLGGTPGSFLGGSSSFSFQGGGSMPGTGANPYQITQDQTNQQVNAAKAQADAGVATQNRSLNASAAARGLGQGSPAIQALRSQNQYQGMQQSAQAAQQIPLENTKFNAQNNLAQQQLQQQAYRDQSNTYLQGQQIRQSGFNSLLGLLG